MRTFDSFFLMNTDDVRRYAVEVLHRFDADEETECREIGDGNINYVFQVRSLRDGRSVIVKQADRLLRSSGRPLDLYRKAWFPRFISMTRPWPPPPWRMSRPAEISAGS